MEEPLADCYFRIRMFSSGRRGLKVDEISPLPDDVIKIKSY